MVSTAVSLQLVCVHADQEGWRSDRAQRGREEEVGGVAGARDRDREKETTEERDKRE